MSARKTRKWYQKNDWRFLPALKASASANAKSQHLKHPDDPFASTREEQLWGDARAAF